jgi:hypothetical protein
MMDEITIIANYLLNQYAENGISCGNSVNSWTVDYRLDLLFDAEHHPFPDDHGILFSPKCQLCFLIIPNIVLPQSPYQKGETS